MRYVCQLGSLLVDVGMYTTAERRLQAVYPKSEDEGRCAISMHTELVRPVHLQCMAALAWARYRQGKVQAARDDVYNVLQGQIRLYLPTLKTPLPDGAKSAKELINSSGLLSRIKERLANTSIHPSLLFTLYIVSQIEQKQDEPDGQFIHNVLDCSFQSLRTALGDDHEWTLMASIALGNAFVSTHCQERIQKAKQCFRFVLDQSRPESHIHNGHPLVLQARREHLKVQIHAGEISHPLQRSGRVCGAIAASQSEMPGPDHPDTLETLLCL